MNIFGGIIGIIFGYALIRYREQIGGMLGDPAWASKVGGIYNVLIMAGILVFIWSLAAMTNTTDFLFAPIFNLFPHPTKAPSTF